MGTVIPAHAPANQLLYATVRIETSNADGAVGSGTGFYYDHFVKNDVSIPVVLTNKHVIDGAEVARFLVSLAVADGSSPSGEFWTVTITDPVQFSYRHPDPNIDLVAIPIAFLLRDLNTKKKVLFRRSFTCDVIRSDEELLDLLAIEDAVMVGYPIGLWDDANNFPILRRGTTASHPAADFRGGSLGLVDIASFPGSSGSPVLIYNSGSYTNSHGGTVMGGSRIILLGVLFAGPQFDAQGNIEVVDVPTARSDQVSTRIPIHLGFYIKAKEIISLMGFVADREAKGLGPNFEDA